MPKPKERASRGKPPVERPGGRIRIRLKAASRRFAFKVSHRRPSPWQPKEGDD